MTSCHGACHPATQILPIDLIFEAANRAMDRVMAEMSSEERAKPNRTGGRFTVAHGIAPNQLRLYGPEKMGILTAERDTLVTYCSIEKASRLYIHPEHQTSRESRNVDLGRYAGAKRFRVFYIFSFSGFSEEDDEKVVDYTIEEIEKLAA